MFKKGDKVRIKDQDHAFCGLYGTVHAVDGDELAIAGFHWVEGDALVKATQSQVEAN